MAGGGGGGGDGWRRGRLGRGRRAGVGKRWRRWYGQGVKGGGKEVLLAADGELDSDPMFENQTGHLGWREDS